MDDFEAICCTHESVELEGFVARPGPEAPSRLSSSGTRPAVLMFPGATGPGPSFRASVRELASAGYVTVGVDMYGRGADITTPKAAGRHFSELLAHPSRLRARALAWLDAVAALAGVDCDRIAALGYCFGGRCVLELARAGAPVRMVSSFHGLLGTHEGAQPGAVTARVAIWTGGHDPYVPPQDLAALRGEFDEAGVDYHLTEFAQARHAFTDPDHDGLAEGIAYDTLAHRVAWIGTRTMLDMILD